MPFFVFEVCVTGHASLWRHLVNNWMEIGWDVEICGKCGILVMFLQYQVVSRIKKNGFLQTVQVKKTFFISLEMLVFLAKF